MEVCFLRNDESQIQAKDKKQLIQDIEDNYSYEVAKELNSAYENIHYVQGYLQEVDEIIKDIKKIIDKY